MRYLKRESVEAPDCLSRFDHRTNDWDDLSKRDKTQIWTQLEQMQRGFCVYCELPATQETGHIEHFFNKGRKDSNGHKVFEHLTFKWDNLFGCCDEHGHCGHYKDKTQKGGKPREYDPAKLLKPDVDDPAEFLQFLENGEVLVKVGIDAQMKPKAEETIKTLNLKAKSLKNSREAVIKRFQQQLKALEGMDEEQQDQEYLDICRRAASGKHFSAVKQVCLD